MTNEQPKADNIESEHEESDVDVRAILGFGAALLTVGLAVAVFLYWLVGFYGRQAERRETRVFPLAAEQQEQLPPEPRLQSDPQGDLRALRTQEEELLKSYGWVNKEAGIARIPIDEAMKLVVQRGLPVRK